MFRSRTLMLFVLAVLLGGGAVWMANRWVLAQLKPTAGSDAAIVVAALEIPFGYKVEPAHVKLVSWPKTTLPPQYSTDVKDVLGKVATQTIYPGEVMIESRLREHLGGSTLSALITPNMRAVTVRVNDVVGVGGFLLPNNRVDVLATRRDQRDSEARTRTILENIKVLAVDQEASQDKEKPVVVRAVTLEMTPEQAEIVVTATEEGSIQLALRNPLDDRAAPKPQLANAPAPLPTLAPVVKPIRRAHPAGPTVNVIKGTTASRVKCTWNEC